MKFTVKVSDLAMQMLEAVHDVRVQRKLYERMVDLEENPDLQGKPLGDELIGFRSIRAVGQRYRIIYQVEKTVITVLIVTLGRRQEKSKTDVYELTKKLLRAGLIERPKKKK
jgi:mRNA interferase RelE/StbE